MELMKSKKYQPNWSSMHSATNINAEGVVEGQRVKVRAVGVIARKDCNPIARYNFALQQYHDDCNRIQNIQLTKICCPCAVSWLYDVIIYFLTQTCCSNNVFCTIFTLIIFVALVFLPYVSLVTLGITCLFFLYYFAGFIVFYYNQKKLGKHQFHERMVPQDKAPPFPDYVNQYFEIEGSNTLLYFQQNNLMNVYLGLKSKYKVKFMAYKQSFLDNNYTYIRSSKVFIFHFVLMACSVTGAYFSVKVFPWAYGRE